MCVCLNFRRATRYRSGVFQVPCSEFDCQTIPDARCLAFTPSCQVVNTSNQLAFDTGMEPKIQSLVNGGGVVEFLELSLVSSRV